MAQFGKRRLSIDLPIEIHSILKKISKKRHMTITKVVQMILIQQLIDEEEIQYLLKREM